MAQPEAVLVENTIHKAIKEAADKSRVAIDIGAHVGDYSVIMADLFKEVIAVEPHDLNLEDMRKRKHLRDNIIVKQGVIGKHDGITKLYTSNCNPGGHTISNLVARLAKWGHEANTFIEVPSWRLDTISKDLDVALIKIDVEGAEEEVLKSGRDLLLKGPMIALETHGTIDTKEIYNFLTGMNYKFFEGSNGVQEIRENNHYLIKR